MKRKLEGACVVLTGASSGIGRAAALAFAKRGANVVLAARDCKALDGIAAECAERHSVRAIAVPTDVCDELALDALAGIAVEELGRIDVWVNDAAVYMTGTIEETPTSAIREIFETNVMGVVHGIRAALGCFRMQGYGTIINVGSIAGKAAYADAGPYCATKHAVHALTAALRQELRGTDIHACLVVPATVDTPLFQHAANFTGRGMLAMRPMDDAERVAEAIVSLAERPRRELTVGSAPLMMSIMNRVLPWMLERGARALTPGG